MKTQINKSEHLEYARRFTSVYRANKLKGNAIREAECLKIQYPYMFSSMKEGDLIAGRYEYPLVYFLPQTYSRGDGAGFGYIFDDSVYGKLVNLILDDSELKELEDIKSFWDSENTVAKMKAAYPFEMRKALFTDNWTSEPGVAFPLYRMAGSILNYDLLLREGINGLEKIIRHQIEQAGSESIDFYTSMIAALNVLRKSCQFYADNIGTIIDGTENENYKEHLLALKGCLKEIQNDKPASFLSAMQLMFLYNSISGSLNFGRMDEYLGDFLVEDLNKGIITKSEAQRYVNSLWKMIIDRGTVFDGRIIIGGKGRRNEKNADEFALMAMEATRITNDILPQLMLRLYEDIDNRLLEKAIDVINEGNTFPMLYNDDVNVKAVRTAFEISEREAMDFAPFGCGEYTIHNSSFETPSGIMNLLKSLEITLNNGIDSITDQQVGLNLGDIDAFKSFGDLWNAYKKQTEYFVDQLALQEEYAYKVAGENSPFLFLSILYDDCIKRGKGIFNGGIKYLGGTLETYGNTNTSDSLLAIKKNVYEDNRFELGEVKKMLDENFAGYEKERQILLKSPKFGNDNEEADEMAILVHNHICNYVRDQRTKTLLHNYLVVIINNNGNTVLGRTTMASADGRLANTSMANANAASGGADKNGITALLNSLVKLDPSIHAGAVQNLKLSKNMLTNHRDKITALIKGYFYSGGTQLMLTVLSKGDLVNARNNPELYPNLLVRVGGYSARFVELESDIQDEIISRTLY